MSLSRHYVKTYLSRKFTNDSKYAREHNEKIHCPALYPGLSKEVKALADMMNPSSLEQPLPSPSCRAPRLKY